MYQSAGDKSMKTPFATMATPSNTAMPRHTDFNIVDPFMGGRGARMIRSGLSRPDRRICLSDQWLSQSSKRVGRCAGCSPGVSDLIVQLGAEVARVDVGDHLARVLLGAARNCRTSSSSGIALGAGDSRPCRSPAARARLGQRRRRHRPTRSAGTGRATGGRVASVARLDDAADELEELRRAHDRVGNPEALISFSWAILARK